MTNIRNIFWTIFILTFFISCDNRNTEKDKQTKQETPKSLQDDKLEIISYSRSGDLTEELYQELVEKSQTLKKLEEDLNAFESKTNNLKEKFTQYDSKSINYYNSVNNKANEISDSLLRKKMISLIAKSSKQYINKTTELNLLLNQFLNKETSLNDQHNVLKIVLTLPIIEKYQYNNILDKNEFKNLIKEQKNLILRTDSLILKK